MELNRISSVGGRRAGRPRSPPRSIRMRLLSASDSRPANRSIPRPPSGSATANAASAVQPPAKTAAGRRGAAPRGRRSWLQAIAPRSVRWRSGRSRAPPPRSRLRPSRSRISAGLSSRIRAAASSMASGSPPGARRSRRRPRAPRRRGRGRAGCALRAIDEQGHAGLGVERRYRVPTLARDPQELAACRRSTRRFGADRTSLATISAASGRTARGCRGRGARSDPGGRCRVPPGSSGPATRGRRWSPRSRPREVPDP